MARAVWRALCNGGLAVCAMADATIRSEAGETKRRSIDACFLLILLSACWLVGLLASLLLGFFLFGPVLCLSSQSRHTCYLSLRQKPRQSADNDALRSERLRLFRR